MESGNKAGVFLISSGSAFRKGRRGAKPPVHPYKGKELKALCCRQNEKWRHIVDTFRTKPFVEIARAPVSLCTHISRWQTRLPGKSVRFQPPPENDVWQTGMFRVFVRVLPSSFTNLRILKKEHLDTVSHGFMFLMEGARWHWPRVRGWWSRGENVLVDLGRRLAGYWVPLCVYTCVRTSFQTPKCTHSDVTCISHCLACIVVIGADLYEHSQLEMSQAVFFLFPGISLFCSLHFQSHTTEPSFCLLVFSFVCMIFQSCSENYFASSATDHWDSNVRAWTLKKLVQHSHSSLHWGTHFTLRWHVAKKEMNLKWSSSFVFSEKLWATWRFKDRVRTTDRQVVVRKGDNFIHAMTCLFVTKGCLDICAHPVNRLDWFEMPAPFFLFVKFEGK